MKHGNYTNFNGTGLPLKFKEFKYWSFLQGSNAKIDDNFFLNFFLYFLHFTTENANHGILRIGRLLLTFSHVSRKEDNV